MGGCLQWGARVGLGIVWEGRSDEQDPCSSKTVHMGAHATPGPHATPWSLGSFEVQI